MNLPELNNCKIAIIGLGYVGLPLAHQFANQNICCKSGKNLNREVIGFDINVKRINELKNGLDTTKEVSKKELKKVSNLKLTSNPKDLENAEIFIITVPTPIDNLQQPDLSFLTKASELVGKVMKNKSSKSNKSKFTNPIVIYESTVYPGVTEDHCRPILDKESGLKFNKDYFLGYSPERINPGDKQKKITSIIKLTSGSNELASNWIDQLYSSIIQAGTFKVKSIKIAEAAKVIENTQRDLNIALVNEFAIIFKLMNIDTLDVLEAANTKWNFLSFKPGLVGGHCIGVDPYYLTYKSEQLGYQPNVVLAGRQINNSMPAWIVKQIVEEMKKKNILYTKAKALIFGITFKENCSDIRNSKIFELIKELENYSVECEIIDPLVEEKNLLLKNDKYIQQNIDFNQKYEIMIFAVPHNQFLNFSKEEWNKLANNSKIIFDLKGIVPRELKPIRV